MLDCLRAEQYVAVAALAMRMAVLPKEQCQRTVSMPRGNHRDPLSSSCICFLIISKCAGEVWSHAVKISLAGARNNGGVEIE